MESGSIDKLHRKERWVKMPQATFKITGEIKDFNRLDNVYKALKREGEKLLDKWTIEVTAEYTETKGGAER